MRLTGAFYPEKDVFYNINKRKLQNKSIDIAMPTGAYCSNNGFLKRVL